MNTIIFGPWTGEFSYELQWWIPECRQLAKQYTNYKKIAIGFVGRKLPYLDFIDEYISYPDSLNDYLIFPDSWGQRLSDKPRTIDIPDQITNYVNDITSNFTGDFIVHKPTCSLINLRFDQNPPGDYQNIEESVVGKKKCNEITSLFDNNNKIICINAKYRKRELDKIDIETLPIEVWESIIRFLISKNFNIVNFHIPAYGTNPGTYDLSHLKLNFSRNFIQTDLINEDSIDIQVSLLKNTFGSIYGSSGSAILPILCNTRMLAIQTKESGFRLKLDWQRRLTNNHKNIIIFDSLLVSNYKKINNEILYQQLNKFLL